MTRETPHISFWIEWNSVHYSKEAAYGITIITVATTTRTVRFNNLLSVFSIELFLAHYDFIVF